jgi:putative DNA primase/helicase
VESGTFKVVILDNLASLALGINENSKQDWEEINQWLLELRSLRVAVIMVHHSGKSGDQRGTSFREDNIDTTIKLTRPPDYNEEDGARFIVRFTKSREAYGKEVKPFCVQIEKSGDGLVWTIKEPEPDLQVYIVALLGLGIPQKEIAEKFRCTPSNVSQAKKKAVMKGLLDEDGNLTEKGKDLYGEYTEEDVLNEFKS